MIGDGAAAGVPIPRVAARVFLIDEAERVLLMHELRDIDSKQSHWITPGGGLEPGENLAEAAVREVYEETGVRVSFAPSDQPVYCDSVTFSIAGSTYAQTNHYFWRRCEDGLAVQPTAHTNVEKLVVLGHRWWSLDDLAASDVDREPAQLVEILRHHLAGDPG